MLYIEKIHRASQFVQESDSDEQLVRQELVRVWSALLNKYAKPGTPIPPFDALRNELIAVGTDAAVRVLLNAHWYLWDFMVRDAAREKIEHGLDQFDLADFLANLEETQYDPQLLQQKLDQIRKYVLEEF